MEESVPYSSMKEVSLVVSSSSTAVSAGYWMDPTGVVSTSPLTTAGVVVTAQAQQHCIIRIVLPEGCLLLQVSNVICIAS